MNCVKSIMVCCVGFSLFFSACENAQLSETGEIVVRTVIESEAGDNADIQVFVEGPDGNAVSGAVVVVRNSSNEVMKIPFDAESCCYARSCPVPSDGMLNFTIQSILCDRTIVYTVPHSPLAEEPVISIFRDSEGKSVLAGQSLGSANELQIAWNSLGSDVIYRVAVKTALGTVYSVSTQTTGILVPAGAIVPGTGYYLEITAQRIVGDPLFRSSSFYSVSARSSAKMGFRVE